MARMELKGKEAALAMLSKAAAAIEKPKALFDEIGGILRASTDDRFEKEQGPDGKQWVPSFRALHEGGMTLTDRGYLRRSITHEATDEGVAVGTNVKYAATHQLGMTIKAKTKRGLRFRASGNGGWVRKMSVDIPQRAFLGIDAEDEKAIITTSERWLAVQTGAEAGNGGD